MTNRKNKLMALLLVLVLVLSTAGCGGSSGTVSNGAKNTFTSESAYDTADYGYYDGAEPEVAEESVQTPAMATSAGGNVDAAEQARNSGNVKIIYTANLDVEALDLDAAVDALQKLVGELGAYVQSSDRGTSGRSRYANYTVRVPSAKYRAFLDAWSDSENIKLTNAREDSEDVGARYFDLETHLTTLRNKMNRLQALLEQATEMEDIIQLESAISDTEYQIELYTSDLNRYDSLINYSTVYLHISEVVKLEEPEEVSFLQRLSQNFRWGLRDFGEALEELVIWIAYNLLTLVVFAAVIVAVVKIHRIRKAKRQGQPAKPRFRFGRRKQTPAAPVTDQEEADDDE